MKKKIETLGTHAITLWVRWLAGLKVPVCLRATVWKFLGNRFGVNWAEVGLPLSQFARFQDFFTRTIDPDLRPIDAAADALVSPVDGTVHSVVPITGGQLFQIKGHRYSLQEFLGPWSSSTQGLEGGLAVTLYLSPKDYHHIHAPVDCELTEGCVVPGTLWPVNPWANHNVLDLYIRNERAGMRLQVGDHTVTFFMVGALCVGGIETRFCHRPKGAWSGKIDPIQSIRKGQELGQFLFGSTVVMLLPPSIRAMITVNEGDQVRVGQRIGTFKGA